MARRWLRRWQRRWRALRRKDEVERELDDELRFHIERETERNVARGMSADDARRAALVRFGGVTRTKQECRDARGVRFAEEVLQDVRYGARMMRKTPGLTLIAVLTLALGIGANSAIFSVVNAVLLRPLGHPEPDRLVRVSLQNLETVEPNNPLGAADFMAIRDRNRTLAGVAAVYAPAVGLAYAGPGGEPQKIRGAAVSADFFDVLGDGAALGRTFARGEDRDGRPRVAVVSYRFWRDRLGGDPAAVGRPISLDGESHTVIGVMPADFRVALTGQAEVWKAIPFKPPQSRPPYYLGCIARLRPGVSAQQAAADLTAIAAQLREQYPNSAFAVVTVDSLKGSIVGTSQRALLVLFGAVLFVLLIASVNLASLLLARGTARERELAVRAALGASRGRIVRQLLTESLLLASIGGALGLLLAVWGVQVIDRLAPSDLPRLEEVSVDGWVLGFTLTVALLSGLVFGLAPALQLSRLDLNTAIKEGGGSGVENAARHRMRALLVVVEGALALMLLTGAGLMIRSFVNLSHVDPGFDPDGVLTMRIELLDATYPDDAQAAALHGQILSRVRSLPGARSAALSMALPPNLLLMSNPYTVEGRVLPPGRAQPVADQLLVSPDYFRTLRIPLRAGRAFTDADREGSPRVLIISETMARHLFPGADPIGRRIQTGDYQPDAPWWTVVGVAADVKYTGLDKPHVPTMYTSYAQDAWWRSIYLTVRTDGAPLALADAVRREVWAVDRTIPISQVRSMEQVMAGSLARSRAYTVLLALFGGVALILAAVGVYGVMSYTVKQRTHEIGIRMALGARAGHVLRMVIGGGMLLGLCGVTIGLVGSILLTRLMEGLLFGVSALDLATFAATAVVLTATMLLACYLPARRAARVDPMVTLKDE